MRKLITLLAALTSFWFQTVAQQRLLISLPSMELSVLQTISAIETQTGYTFSYSNRVDVTAMLRLPTTRMTTQDLLEEIGRSTGITYQVRDYKVVLKPGVRRHTINGYLRDRSSGENLIGGNLYTADGRGTTSNAYGHYSISIEEGEVRLTASYVGYEALAVQFELTADTTINFLLTGSMLDEVVVTGETTEPVHESSQMSSLSMPLQNLVSMPALGGEVDIMRGLTLLPGVQGGAEGNSGLYVRGGGPDQNLILLDGVPVYNASHLFGFFSVFNADAINHVELIKGGFPARYGGRLSSVVDISMKEGSKERFRGSGSVGLIASRLTLEGPAWNDKATFIVSARRTYADIVARPFLRKKSSQFGYYFYDVNAKFNYTFNKQNRLYVSAYTGKDDAYATYRSVATSMSTRNTYPYKSDASINWGNLTTAVRWNSVLSPRLFSNVSASYSQYRFEIETSDRGIVEGPAGEEIDMFFKSVYFSGIKDYSLKADFDFLPADRHFVKFGGYAIDHHFSPGASNQVSYLDEQPLITGMRQRGLEYGGYIEDDWVITRKLKLNLGAHYSGYLIDGTSFTYLQPRLSARSLITSGLSIKGSYSEMAQYLHLLSNSGVGLPTDMWVPATSRIAPQLSKQTALGMAWMPTAKYEFTLEGYYKEMKNLIEYKNGASYLGTEEDWQEKVEVGKGESYGAELFMHKKSGVVNGWVGYTLSWSNRQFDNLNFGKWFPYRYDRRHDFEVVGNWSVSKRLEWSATWVFATGNAITLPIAEYSELDKNPRIGPHQNYNEYYSDRNAYRLRPYHRLDLSLKLKKKTRWGDREWVFSLYNAYSRRNPYYVQYALGTDGKIYLWQYSLFPIIPLSPIISNSDASRSTFLCGLLVISCDPIQITEDIPDVTNKISVNSYVGADSTWLVSVVRLRPTVRKY